MKTVIANYKNLERHGLFVELVRVFSVPLLNALPEIFLQKFMRTSSHDAGVVLDVGSGTGNLILRLKGKCKKIIGLDFLEEGIKIHKKRHYTASNSVFFRLTDILAEFLFKFF